MGLVLILSAPISRAPRTLRALGAVVCLQGLAAMFSDSIAASDPEWERCTRSLRAGAVVALAHRKLRRVCGYKAVVPNIRLAHEIPDTPAGADIDTQTRACCVAGHGDVGPPVRISARLSERPARTTVMCVFGQRFTHRQFDVVQQFAVAFPTCPNSHANPSATVTDARPKVEGVAAPLVLELNRGTVSVRHAGKLPAGPSREVDSKCDALCCLS